jgi:hypothetical protein
LAPSAFSGGFVPAGRQTFGFGHETMDTLDEAPAAFRPFLRPFDVALGR